MKRLVLLIVFAFSLISVNAQFNFSLRNPNRQNNNSSKDPITNRIYFGGGGGFGAGTDQNGNRYNYYTLLPVIGYRINQQFSVGASFTYQRYNYLNTIVGNYSFTQYGFGPYARYTINPIFVQAEFDVINAPAYDANNEVVRANYNRFLVGLGYVLPLGKRSAINAMAMYDLLYRVPSVFNSPFVIRVYFVF